MQGNFDILKAIVEVADLNCDTRKIIVKCKRHRTSAEATDTENVAHEGE